MEEHAHLVVIQMAKGPSFMLIGADVFQKLVADCAFEASRMPSHFHCVDNTSDDCSTAAATNQPAAAPDRHRGWWEVAFTDVDSPIGGICIRSRDGYTWARDADHRYARVLNIPRRFSCVVGNRGHHINTGAAMPLFPFLRE